MGALRIRDFNDQVGELGFRLRVVALPELPPLIRPLSSEELARRNAAVIALLDTRESSSDEGEQRRAVEVLRDALGPNRLASNRSAFP